MNTPDGLSTAHIGQERGLRTFLSLEGDCVGDRFPADRYLFVCFTNRCGSDFLSQALASSGRLPESLEPFNLDTTRAMCDLHDIKTFDAYFAFQTKRLGRYGWFCSKLALGQLLFLNAVGILDAIMPRSSFILLERNDKVAQAISRRIAWQTGRWTSRQTSAVAEDELVYDKAAIDNDVAAINRQVAGFRLFFMANRVTPIHISYEGLVGDLDGTLREVGDGLGLSALIADRSKIMVTKMDNRVNKAWRRRYTQALAPEFSLETGPT